jgi:hypothetical protein
MLVKLIVELSRVRSPRKSKGFTLTVPGTTRAPEARA